MYYMFYKYDAASQEAVLEGIVQVQPIAGKDDVEVVQVIPDEFTDHLEQVVYGKEFDILAAETGEPDAVFSQHVAAHWRALPKIFRMNGYGGVEEYTDEEFLNLAELHGYEEPGETD